MRVAALLVAVLFVSGCDTVRSNLPPSVSSGVTSIVEAVRAQSIEQEYARQDARRRAFEDSIMVAESRERMRADSMRAARSEREAGAAEARRVAAERARAEQVAASAAADVAYRANAARALAIDEASRGTATFLLRVPAVLRDTVGLGATMLRELPSGTVLDARSYDGRYWGVRLEDGTYGYVSGASVEATPAQIATVTRGTPPPAPRRAAAPRTTTTTRPSAPARSSSRSSRTTTARRYQRGARGGCYYINAQGNREYVSRDLCR